MSHHSKLVHRIVAIIFLFSAALGSLPTHSFADLIDGGHWDLELAYTNGSWDPHWHGEEGEEKDLADTVVRGIFDSTATNGVDSPSIRPNGTNWDFTGTSAGSTLYVFPASDPQPHLPFLGIGAQEITLGTFLGDTIDLEFLGILNGPSGGAFSMWGINAFSVIPLFSSSSSALTVNANKYQANIGTHNHFNLAFTQVGQYELSFKVSGTLVNGSVTQSGPFSVRFEVLTAIPEPSSLMMLGISGFGALFMRRRRTLVQIV